MLHIGAALFYYKLGQMLLQVGAASLLQIGTSAIYYRLGQLLQIWATVITKYGNYYR